MSMPRRIDDSVSDLHSLLVMQGTVQPSVLLRINNLCLINFPKKLQAPYGLEVKIQAVFLEHLLLGEVQDTMAHLLAFSCLLDISIYFNFNVQLQECLAQVVQASGASCAVLSCAVARPSDCGLFF